MNLKKWLATCVILGFLSGATKAEDLSQKYVGKNNCTPGLNFRYGIRLDSTQRAYLTAYDLKEAHILAIVQRKDDDDDCGVIRDVVQSGERDSSFLFECLAPSIPSEVVVGTWPAKHPRVTGRAVKAWKIDLRELKFHPLSTFVKCRAGNDAGADEGDSLADWARKRAAKHSDKLNP
jgi:hypothetical protein